MCFPVPSADVEEGTPAAEGVSDADLKKRAKGWMEKKRKLKDPKYAISLITPTY